MSDTLADRRWPTPRGFGGRGIPFDALVNRVLRNTLGIDPSVADAARIRRLLTSLPLAPDGLPVEPSGVAAGDEASRDIAREIAAFLERARAVIARTEADLRTGGAPERVTRRLVVALHDLEVADQLRALLLVGPFAKQIETVGALLSEVTEEIQDRYAESALHLAVAFSALDCAASSFDALLKKRDDNCAARVSDVVGKLECVRAAVGAIRVELDLLGPAPDPDCVFVEWAEAPMPQGAAASKDPNDLTFAQFFEVAERSAPRLVRLLDSVGADGLRVVRRELRGLQETLQGPHGDRARPVVLPGGEDSAAFQRLLDHLDQALTEARTETTAALTTCRKEPDDEPGSRPARARRPRAAARS